MSLREVAWRTAGALPSRDRGRAEGRPDWLAEPWRSYIVELTATGGDRFVADAARIAAGELSLWGQQAWIDASRPAWNLDPLDGIDVAEGGRDWAHDIKPVLELHRQQHLLALAAGANLSDNDGWAELCGAQILDWIERNPAGEGPAWNSGYEAAHRLIGWAWIVPLISGSLSAEQLTLIADSYVAQAGLTASQPSRFSSANNHRIIELVGLLAADAVGVRTAGWDGLWKELEDEALAQTYTDGGSREQAGGYFLYVLETLWLASVTALGAGKPLGRIEERLTAMTAWLGRVADEGGEPPPLGDDAEDRIIRTRYFEPRAAGEISGRVGALLEARPTLTPEPTGPVGLLSEVLDESGLAVFRGSVGDARVRVVVDIGELGLGSIASHAHADALSVLVDVGGKRMLRDSGTYSYAPGEGRDDYRRTDAHSTVSIDGRNQAEVWGPHLWGPRFNVDVEASHLDGDVDYLRASHDGFKKHPSKAVHTRSVIYLRPGLLVVLDRVLARRTCVASLAWQLPPGDDPERLGDGLGAMTILSLPEGSTAVSAAPFSPRYRAKEEASRVTVTARGEEVVFASMVSLSSPVLPVGSLSHSGGVTTLDLANPRPMRIVENWRDDLIEVQS